MKILCGGRGNGKTLEAIRLSVEKQIPIICWNCNHKKYIERMAHKRGVKSIMPEPILATEAKRRVIGNRKGLIVDDLDVLLELMLNDTVLYATMEDCEIEKINRSDT